MFMSFYDFSSFLALSNSCPFIPHFCGPHVIRHVKQIIPRSPSTVPAFNMPCDCSILETSFPHYGSKNNLSLFLFLTTNYLQFLFLKFLSMVFSGFISRTTSLRFQVSSSSISKLSNMHFHIEDQILNISLAHITRAILINVLILKSLHIVRKSHVSLYRHAFGFCTSPTSSF